MSIGPMITRELLDDPTKMADILAEQYWSVFAKAFDKADIAVV